MGLQTLAGRAPQLAMLQLHLLREQTDEVIARLQKKNVKNAGEAVGRVLELDAETRRLKAAAEDLQSQSNALARQVGDLMKAGQREEAEAVKGQTGELKERLQQLSQQLKDAENKLDAELVLLPNLPHASVPAGRTPEENEVVRQVESLPTLHEGALPHWELTAKHKLIDFELGVKITGAGFPVYRGKGARLQRALINWFLDQATAAGYEELEPPILVNEESGYGTGQLPDKEGQMYHVTIDNLYLAPTAEVPVTNLFRDVVLREEELPVRCTAYTPCFRREAGSYGKDVRGLNRLHQFDKVEIVQIARPENSYEVLESMVAHVEGLLQMLGLPYRILRLCGGDMSFASALTFDFEVWSAGQSRWLEVSSVSNFETFQANRLKLRYKPKEGKGNVLCHTLNGSALALPRIVAALLENNQQPDGSIRIPECLVPYTGFEVI